MDTAAIQLSLTDLHNGLDEIRESPKNNGTLDMIVARPSEGVRKVLDEGRLELTLGLVGDNWSTRGSRHTPDKTSHPEMQLNLMNSRAIQLISQAKHRWQLAGDQLFVDLDLSGENLPPGTRLSIGSAVIEITPVPHTGCAKFIARFGVDAQKFVNSPVGRTLNLRGVNAKVVTPGTIRVGDKVARS
jgi:hypothetical protein